MTPPDRDGSRRQATRPERPWWGLLWIGVAVAIYLVVGNPFGHAKRAELSYTEFRHQVDAGNVADVHVRGQEIDGKFREPYTPPPSASASEGAPEGSAASGKRDEKASPPTYDSFHTTFPLFAQQELGSLLERKHVEITAKSETGSAWLELLVSFLPFLLILGLFWYGARMLANRASSLGGPGGPFGVGRSRAHRFKREEGRTSFAEVAGLEEPKRDFRQVIDFLKDPRRYRELGAKLPRGILLMGPPGTGKTLLARAVAGEANVPFFSTSGSEFIETFVGVGAARVRSMFAEAKQEAPAVVFIDEIDSVGRSRGTGLGGGHDEREQTLNQILSEMDGFSLQKGLIVLAATNRPDVLDPALLRPGRFDRKVTLDLPRREARRKILEVHTREVPLAPDVDLGVVAASTVGFSGADLENLVNEAALLAGRDGARQVRALHFDRARDTLVLGRERADLLSDAERRWVAYHEAGHALLAALEPRADPLRKVTIIPRGRALGATEQVPDESRLNRSRSELSARITVMLGGRAAEQVVFDEPSSGAADDLKQATALARRMVTEFGMSDRLGAASFRYGEEHVFLGKELTQPRQFSEHTAQLIDDEVREIVGAAERRALQVLRQRTKTLEALAQALLEHESLEQEAIEDLIEAN